MQNFCIVTDSSVQFPDEKVTGMENIKIVEHKVSVSGRICKLPQSNKSELPLSLSTGKLVAPKIIPPPVSQFFDLFTDLSAVYRNIICITSSSGLTPTFNNAQVAAQMIKYSDFIHIYDSHNTSLGLGFIVQSVLKAFMAGDTMEQVDQIIRNKIANSYSMVACSNMSYLHSNGFVDFSQALVTEMIGLISIFSLEDGRLNPLEKVRSYQVLIEFIQEFLDEFDALEMIGFVQSVHSMEKNPLTTFVKDHFPYSIFRQDSLSPQMSILFGPDGMGIFVVEADT